MGTCDQLFCLLDSGPLGSGTKPLTLGVAHSNGGGKDITHGTLGYVGHGKIYMYGDMADFRYGVDINLGVHF